jgi:glycosyltransferase involved in cell wall biosynthesis
MVSKALVMGAYQRKLEELARQPDLELTAIVPPSWREAGGTAILDRAHTSGYRLLVAPLALNGRFHLHFYPDLSRLLGELRPDILHMDEEPYNLATWHALKAAESVGARSLFFTWQNLERSYPWPFAQFEHANYRRAAHAIAGNERAAEVLCAKGYSGPISVIPQFGVDPVIFSPRDDVGQGKPAETGRNKALVIGYAGRLVPEKGVHLLIQACAMLSQTEWRLRIAGDGPQRESLETNALAAGVLDRVEFLGRIVSTRVAEFYRTLDVFVLPSESRPNWIEQFGRVLIEAMSCGVPVVGSSCGEIPHVIGDAGLVFQEGNVDELSSALCRLADASDLRARLSHRGRERVLERFTHAQVAAATGEVYRTMLACPNGAARPA